MIFWRRTKMDLKDDIIKDLKKIYDPEIPVNIYDLGLIYEIKISDNNCVKIVMTLTSPNCPVAESLPNMVKEKVKNVKGVMEADVQIVWSPPWTKDMMSDAAKLELNL
tara:strand:+ start:2400 stop:2723 length:324 start_codon:yes stop_codon:yes gene_type:complete